MILITTANGMFGGAVLEALKGSALPVRAMVRDISKLPQPPANTEVRAWDMDDPVSVRKAMDGVEKLFLCTPMDAKIAEREGRIIEAAQAAGVQHIVKLYGAVEHGDDPLISQHKAAIAAMKASGLNWTLLSPTSVMETSVLSFREFVIEEDNFYGMSGQGRIGFVALQDVARIAAQILTTEGHSGQNYEVTGPATLTMFDVAAIISEAVGRTIGYVDMPEEAFTQMMKELTGMPDDALEREIICHLRCWREGKAELVTDTFAQLTGDAPTTLAQWAQGHKARFC